MRKITKKRGGRRKLMQAADILWAKAVKAKGYCERCGKRRGEVNLQAAHIHSRTHYCIRHDLLNGLSLCVKCHLYWAHKEPLQFAQWLQKDYPERVVYLDEKLLLDEKPDYAEIILRLKRDME